MEAQNWIIGQIIIDIIIAVLLLLFIKLHFKRREPGNDMEAIFHKSEKILTEMGELSRQFEKNLEEKRELSRKIIGQLDESLKMAEQTFRQVQTGIKGLGTNIAHLPDTSRDAAQVRSSVNALLAKGLSREEVAQHLGISVGEIELLIKLQGQPNSSKSVSRE